MTTPRELSRKMGSKPQVERLARVSHNKNGDHNDDKADKRIVAIVKLLARLAAESDFYDDPPAPG